MASGSVTVRRLVQSSLAVLLACSSVLLSNDAALAGEGVGSSGRSGCQAVHAGTQQVGQSSGESYFRLTLNAGDQQRAAILLANPEAYPCSVTLERASGETAVNSGDTYPVPEEGCTGSSCWLSGLPATVSVPAGGRLHVSFQVRVPARTPAGEYLAGVVVRPTAPPPVARPSSPDKQVAVSVAARVAIGVAVIVSGSLHAMLTIPSVTLDISTAPPRLQVHVRNLGNTWEHPTGGARIRVRSGTRGFGVRSNTILARDEAVLPLPVEGVQRGNWTTDVVLSYGDHQRAVWHGELEYPTPPITARGQSQSSALTAAQALPAWVLGVIATLGLLVIVLAVVLVAVFRKRRRDGDGRLPTDPVENASSGYGVPVDAPSQ